MINDEDIILMFSFFKQVSPQISENIQFYNESEISRFGHVVKYNKGKMVVAVWLDFTDLNEYKLKVLFQKHKQVKHSFFIQQIDNFYRIGWKIKKQ